MTTQNNSKKRLGDYCYEILNLVLKLRIKNDFGDATAIREKILNMLNQMEINAQKNGIPAIQTEQARFAIIALIDEFVITSDWDQKEIWIANPLQMQLYNRFDAGEEFFKRLKAFQLNPEKNIAVIEVYYICLGLGFKGKYAIEEQENLRLITRESYDELKKALNGASKALSPSGIPEDSGMAYVLNKLPFWHIGLGALILGFIFYLIVTLISINAVVKAVDLLPK